jgi:DNA-binding NtrC family response regulator
MTQHERFPGAVLFVDDNTRMRELFVEVADFAQINNVEVFADAEKAGTRLRTSEEPFSVVFSDGLNGGWRHVIAAAKEVKVPAIVLSADDAIEHEVKEAGAVFIPKVKLAPRLLKNVMAELQSPAVEYPL